MPPSPQLRPSHPEYDEPRWLFNVGDWVRALDVTGISRFGQVTRVSTRGSYFVTILLKDGRMIEDILFWDDLRPHRPTEDELVAWALARLA